MEGVLVSAKKAGSTITITVVSDKDGHYSFPANKLEPGTYALRIRAIGYDLDNHKAIDVGPDKTTTADLKLRKTEDLAAQMSNGEWLDSIPGTNAQKGMLLNCVGCHTLDRPLRSNHTAEDFATNVLPRMQGYVNQSIPEHPQLRKAERQMEERGDARLKIYKAAAEYLSTINLNGRSTWSFQLNPMPRPGGRATRVIYTEYDLPRETIEPHDVIVDKDGIAWYSSFGEQNLGRLDPKTGAVKEYSDPRAQAGLPHRPPRAPLGPATAICGSATCTRPRIVKFDPKTEKFQYWPLPKELNVDAAQLNMVSPQSSHVDGKVWAQNNGFAGIHRLDLASGKIETWEPFKTPRSRTTSTTSSRTPRTTCSSPISGCVTSAGSTPRPAR